MMATLSARVKVIVTFSVKTPAVKEPETRGAIDPDGVTEKLTGPLKESVVFSNSSLAVRVMAKDTPDVCESMGSKVK